MSDHLHCSDGCIEPSLEVHDVFAGLLVDRMVGGGCCIPVLKNLGGFRFFHWPVEPLADLRQHLIFGEELRLVLG